jgi:hypothetical protein
MTETQRELAHRFGGGIEVTLYWNAADNSTSVEIFHPTTEQTLHFAVRREHALDAFYHPFVHMQTRSEGAPLDSHESSGSPRRVAVDGSG